jgi:hypothetical protein
VEDTSIYDESEKETETETQTREDSTDDESETQTVSPTPRPSHSHSSHASYATHTKYTNTYNISALLHSSTLPYTSAPFILRAKAGDQDGINLPSFPVADATLLFWEIHRDVAEIPLRVRIADESTVQIWPDSKYWVSLIFLILILISRDVFLVFSPWKIYALRNKICSLYKTWSRAVVYTGMVLVWFIRFLRSIHKQDLDLIDVLSYTSSLVTSGPPLC